MSFMRERPVNALTTEVMRRRHLRRVLQIEDQVYPRPWTHRTFVSELTEMRNGSRYYMVAYVDAIMVGYAITGLWPDQWTWLGASIIIGAGLYIAVTETRARQA